MRIVDGVLDIDASGNIRSYEYGSIGYIKQVIDYFLYTYKDAVVYSNNYSNFLEVLFLANKESDVVSYVGDFVNKVSVYIGDVIKDYNVELDKINKVVKIEFFIAGGDSLYYEYTLE